MRLLELPARYYMNRNFLFTIPTPFAFHARLWQSALDGGKVPLHS